MPNWFAGLPRRASAERAAKWGAVACLFQSARETLGNLFTASMAHKPLDNAIAWFVGQSLLPILVVAAGITLWRRTQWIWGALAGLLLTADLAAALLNLGPTIDAYARITASAPSAAVAAKAALLTGFVMKAVLIILIINGTRGVLALKKFDYSTDLGVARSSLS